MEGMVKAGGVDEDMGDGMQCSEHPYRSNPGGICAFCLQDKLGKLVSSSLPLPVLPPSSSSTPSSPPSFRSDFLPPASSSSSTSRPSASASASASSFSLPSSTTSAQNQFHTRRARLPFLLTRKKKKKKKNKSSANPSSSAATSDRIIFKRSKSTATPRRGPFLDDPPHDLVIEEEGFSPRKRGGFWSFLHFSSKSSVSANKSFRESNNTPRISINGKQKDKCLGSSSSLGKKTDIVAEDDDSSSASASASSFERKVSRSRSVGCGSRSFSGDFFERISTGFGDCALRRVESHREGKPKVAASSASAVTRHSMKERVKCGGLFSGFMLNSSSSSSSSSSYFVSSSNDDNNSNANGKSAAVALSHGRAGRSWGWAFASPMRAFSTKPSSKDVKNPAAATPNLSAVPSMLAVRG